MISKQFTLSRPVRFVSVALVTVAVGVAFAGAASAASSAYPDLVQRAVQAHKSQVQPPYPDLVERAVQAHKRQIQVLAPDDLSRVIQKPASSFYTPEGLYADGLRAQGIAEVYQGLQGRPAASFYTPQALKAEGMRLESMAAAYKTSGSETTNSGSGFDWSDGGIGVAGGLALLLCSASLILVARRKQEEHLAV